MSGFVGIFGPDVFQSAKESIALSFNRRHNAPAGMELDTPGFVTGYGGNVGKYAFALKVEEGMLAILENPNQPNHFQTRLVPAGFAGKIVFGNMLSFPDPLPAEHQTHPNLPDVIFLHDTRAMPRGLAFGLGAAAIQDSLDLVWREDLTGMPPEAPLDYKAVMELFSPWDPPNS